MDIREMVEMKREFLHDTMNSSHYYEPLCDYDDDSNNDTLMENAIDVFNNDTKVLFGEQYKNEILVEEMLWSATTFEDCEIVEEALLDSLADMKDKVIKTIKDLWIRFRDWLTRIMDAIRDLFNYSVPEGANTQLVPSSGGGSPSVGSSSGGSNQKPTGGKGGNLALPSPSGGSSQKQIDGKGGNSALPPGGSSQKQIGGPSGTGLTKAEGPKQNANSGNKEKSTSKKKMSKADFKALKSRVISQYRVKQDTVEYKGYTYYNEDKKFINAMKQCADISDIVSQFKAGNEMSRMDYFDKVERIIGGNPKDRGEDGYVQTWIISKIRNNKFEQHKLKDMPLGLLTKYGMEEATVLDQCNELMNIYKNLFKDVETTINNCDDAKKVKVMTRLCSQATKFGTFCIGVYTREYRKAIKFCSALIRKIII